MISLIVLNYNGREHLQTCFSSIFAQSLLPDEIFLMDNGSTDGSLVFMSKNFPHVEIIVEKRKNFGTAGASNIAFSHTKGDYVIFQSNDIRLDTHCAAELVKALDNNKKIGMASSVLLKFGTGRIDNAGGIVDCYGFGMQNRPNEKVENMKKNEDVFFSYGGSFIVRRDLFEKVGGYDNRFFTLNDDLDLSWRIRLLGYKIVCVKKSIVHHKVSATLGKIYDRPKKHYWSERNLMRTFLKNASNRHLIFYFPQYLFLFFAEMAYFLYRLKFALFWVDIKAFLWNVIYLPETLRFRCKIQANRVAEPEKLMKKTSFKLKLFPGFKNAI